MEAAEVLGAHSITASQDPEYRVLYDSSSDWHDLTGTWPMHHVLGTYGDILQADPELPRRMVEALWASRDYARRHMPRLIDEFVEGFGGDRGRLAKWADEHDVGERFAWSMDEEDRRTIQTVMDLLLEYNYVDKQYTVDDMVVPWS